MSQIHFDIHQVRSDFPILDQEVNGHPLVYLDNAATTQKPQQVIDAISHYYLHDNANVHRGAHTLSDRATENFEHARDKVQTFIHAPTREQILWTRGTTEAVNLVAQCFAPTVLTSGDQVLVTAMEHHSNIVPWQMVAERTGAEVIAIPVTADGSVDLDQLHARMNERVKIVSIGHVSNALGTVNPVAEIIAQAKTVDATVMLDGAQAVGHFPVDVQALDVDFYAFSGHKVFAPTGIGVLYGKRELLEKMPPYMGGGEMIESVSFSGTTYNQLPYKFEAGTPDIAGAIGLGAAIDYLNQFDRAQLMQHESVLLQYLHDKARDYSGLEIIGTADNKSGVMSFLIEGTHPADVGLLLDQQGVAVRTGNHCAQPIMDQFGIPGTIRASLSFYNNHLDIDRLFDALDNVKQFLH